MVRTTNVNEGIGMEFYLKIIDPGRDAMFSRAYQQYESKINAFLASLFSDRGYPSGGRRQAPLKYGNHSVVEQEVVQVSFRLAPNANNVSLCEAAESFCEAVFAKPESLGNLTVRGLLGVEPEGELIQKQWYRAMFRAVLTDGKPLLKALEAGYQHPLLVDWALTLCFCIVAQVNCRAVTEQETGEFSEEAVDLAEKILNKFFDKNTAASPSSADVDLNKAMDDLVACLRPIVATNPTSLALGIDMRLPLFSAAHAAACVLVSNREIFKEFIRRRKIAAKKLAAGNVFLHASAVAHHSTRDLLSRETAGDFCSSKLVEEPTTRRNFHPAWWAAAPIVLPFAMAGGVFYGPYKLGQWASQEQFEKRLTGVNELAVFVARAFGLALDIRVMLGWIHWEREALVSDQAKEMCRALLGSDKGLHGIVKYLREQGEGLETWRELLDVAKR